MAPMQRMIQMAKNFNNMTKKEQDVVLKANKAALKLAQDKVDAVDKELLLQKSLEKKL